MAGRRELEMLTGFGRGLDSALLFAVQPDEWADEPWNHRTFVVRPGANSVVPLEVLPRPVHESWQSTNGTGYCPSNNGQLLIYTNGAWATEIVCSRNEEFGAMTGFGAPLPANDELILCGSASIFVRRNRRWTEHRVPDDIGELYGLHGLTPKEVYICTDAGLYLWDGKQLEATDGPDDDELNNLLVLSSTELIAVGENVHMWTDKKGWRELKSPCDDVAAGLCQSGSDVFIPSLEGILQLKDGKLKKVSAFGSNPLVAIGDHVIAAGTDGGICRSDGPKWTRIALPKLAQSENP